MSWTLIQNSLFVAIASTLLASFAGFAFAIFAAALPPTFRRLSLGLAAIVLILPPFLVTNSWLDFFGLNGAWRSYVDFDLYSLKGTILLLTLQLWPVSALAIAGALLRIDRVYLEQDAMLRGVYLLRYVGWPAVRGLAGLAAVITFVLAFNNFSVPTLLQVKVFAEEVWLSFNTKFDFAEAFRLSWPLIAAPLLLLCVSRWQPARFSGRSVHFSDELWRQRLGGLFPAFAICSLLIIVVSLFFPLSQLLSSNRTWTELRPAIAAGQNALINSLLFALLSAAVVFGLGLLTARWNYFAPAWFLFLVPGVVLGIAFIRIFNRPLLTSFYQSIGIVVLAFACRYFAIGWSCARLVYSSVDRTLKEAVATLGGSRWQVFRLGIWPQRGPAFLVSFYLVYLLCLWEVETLILIVPPGRETLALRIFNMLHYGHAGQVDALCVWMLILGFAPALLFLVGRAFASRAGIAVLPLLLAGCGVSPENATQLESKLFSSVQVFGSRGTGVGQFNKPRSIAVDREDNFYVVDMTGRVQKFSPDGQFLLSWQMPQTEKGKPKGMACDQDGNIIVVEPHYSRANHFTPEGRLVAQWGVNGTNEGQLFFPRAVAVNSRGDIYLSEYGMVERIQEFSPGGTNFLRLIGRPGTEPGGLNRAEGIGIGPDDSLFEADSCNHRIQVFSPEGKLVTIFGSPGSAPNELSYPYDVRIDPAGYRFVCEFGNSRVQVFDSQNRSFEIIGGAGAEPGKMNNPWAIALDSRGNLYLADSLNYRVQKFVRRDPPGSGRKVAAQ